MLLVGYCLVLIAGANLDLVVGVVGGDVIRVAFGVVVGVMIIIGEVGSEVGCGMVGTRALNPELSSLLLSLLEKSIAAACSHVGTVLRAITLILCRACLSRVFSTFFWCVRNFSHRIRVGPVMNYKV